MSRSPELHGAYEREEVEILLGELLNGGTQWDRQDAPDADMPTTKGNPARGGSHMAAIIDTERALRGLLQLGELSNPAALYLHYLGGRTQAAVGKMLGITQQGVAWALDADIGRLRDAMNEGLRPGGRRAS